MLATLLSLRIRNLALVEKLDWELKPGFIAVTGETGAGKSVIIGALKLLLGERAEKSLIRTGQESCTVEATFRIDNCDTLDRQLAEHGIDDCRSADGHLVIKRIFSQTGGTRQFVNGSASTLQVLKQLGDQLIDLHGPHDHQSLLCTERQLDLLDSFAQAHPTRRQYESLYRRYQQLRSDLATLIAEEANADKEIEVLQHQVAEIENARLDPNEEDATRAKYAVASNARRLIELSTGVSFELAESEPSIIGRLSDAGRFLRELEKIDPAASDFVTAHSAAVIELEELARGLSAYAERLDIDPEQLRHLEERVSLFETLKRKYGGSIPDVIRFYEEATARLQKIGNRAEERAQYEKEITEATKSLRQFGEKLTKLRADGAPKLSTAVAVQLRDLGFKKSEFEIRLVALDSPGAHGFESVEFVLASKSSGLESVDFLFAPNPGEPAKPLRSIASSGEISRVMLAVKSALADQDEIPLLVFDEIDANVGGEIAHAVGAKMQSLGKNHQVLCITHLPQVAAAAGDHFVVSKNFDGERTLSTLTQVSGAEREKEISRMLGGSGDAADALAKQLLGGKKKSAKNG